VINYGVDEVVPLLLKACPALEPDWKKYLEVCGAEDPGAYIDAGEIASIVVDLFRRSDTGGLPRLFERAEELLREGDGEARNLVVVGLFEGLQNVASHEPFGYAVFRQWLGPLSAKAWDQLEETWNGKTGLSDVVRAERGIDVSAGRGEMSAPDAELISDPWLRRTVKRLYRRREK
jgi:hypothetical protein